MDVEQPNEKKATPPAFAQPLPIPPLATIAAEDAQAAAIAQSPDVNAQASRWINERDPAAWQRALQIAASTSAETTLLLALMQLRHALMLHYTALDETALATILHCLARVASQFAGSRRAVAAASALYALLVRRLATARNVGKSWNDRYEGTFFPSEYVPADRSAASPLAVDLPLPIGAALARAFATCSYEPVRDIDGAVFVEFNTMPSRPFRRKHLVPLVQLAMARVRAPHSAADRLDALDLLTAVLEFNADTENDESLGVRCGLRDDHDQNGAADDDDLLGSSSFYADLMRAIDVPALNVLCAIARCGFSGNDKVPTHLKACIRDLLTTDGGALVMRSDAIHHEACRLIYTLLSNHCRMSNAFVVDTEFLQLLVAFSTATIAVWRSVPHGMHYMMGAWSAVANRRSSGNDTTLMLPIVAAYVTARMSGASDDDALAIDGRFDDELSALAAIVRHTGNDALTPLLDLQPACGRQHLWLMHMLAALLNDSEIGNAARQKVLRRAFDIIKTPLTAMSPDVHVQSAFVSLATAVDFRCLRYGGFDFGTVEQHFASATQLRYLLIAKVSALLGAADGTQPDLLERALNLLTSLLTGASGDAGSIANTDDASLARMLALRDSLFARADGNRALYATRIAYYAHLGATLSLPQFERLVIGSFEHRLRCCPPDAAPTMVGILVDLSGLFIRVGREHRADAKYKRAFALAMRYLTASANSCITQRDVFLRRAKLIRVMVATLRTPSVSIDVFGLVSAAVACIAACGTHFAQDERVLIVMLRLWNALLLVFVKEEHVLLRMAIENYDAPLWSRLLRMTGLLPTTVGPDALQRQRKLVTPFYGILTRSVMLDKTASRNTGEHLAAILRAVATGIEYGEEIQREHGVRSICMTILANLAKRARKNEALRAPLLPLRDQMLSLFLRTPFTLDLARNCKSNFSMAALYDLLALHPSFSLGSKCSERQAAWLKDMITHAACGSTYADMQREFRIDNEEACTWTFARPPDLSAALASFAI